MRQMEKTYIPNTYIPNHLVQHLPLPDLEVKDFRDFRTHATCSGIVGHCYKINESKRNSDRDKNVSENNSTQLSTMTSIISEC